MARKPEKIRTEMAQLETELETAEKQRSEKNRKKIDKAAERSGLDKIELTTATLDREFKAMARRLRADNSDNAIQSGKSESGKNDEGVGNDASARSNRSDFESASDQPAGNVSSDSPTSSMATSQRDHAAEQRSIRDLKAGFHERR